MLFIGRVLLGIAVAMASVAVTLYNSEMAPAQHRGRLNQIFQVCFRQEFTPASSPDLSSPLAPCCLLRDCMYNSGRHSSSGNVCGVASPRALSSVWLDHPALPYWVGHCFMPNLCSVARLRPKQLLTVCWSASLLGAMYILFCISPLLASRSIDALA